MRQARGVDSDTDCSAFVQRLPRIGTARAQDRTALKRSATVCVGTLQKIVTKVILPGSDEVSGCNKAHPVVAGSVGQRCFRRARARRTASEKESNPMALGVLNNLSAIYAENNLNNTNNSLQTVLQQLSSGSKINSGADDAAGLSLVNGLAANSAALTQSGTNATEGVGLLDVADGALSQVTSLLDRAITLATEASNGTLNSTQEGAANQEYQSILAEVNNVGSTTTYNQQAVFSGNTTAIYTGDSSTTGSSIDDLNIRTLSEQSVGDTGGAMSYSSGENNVFLNLSSSTVNATVNDTLNSVTGTTTIAVKYLVKGSEGSSTTASTSISVGTGTNFPNTVTGLIGAINNSGLGLTASFATQAGAGITGGGSQTGIEISGGLVSAGVDPSSSSTSGILDPSGIPASELLTQGQTINVSVGGTSVGSVAISPLLNTLAEVASAINGWNSNNSPVTATVITNGDGTQSLSLTDTAGGGALAVTASGSVAAAVPTLSAPTTSDSTVLLNSVTGNTPGIAANAGSYGSETVGVATNTIGMVDGGADTATGGIVITDGAGAAQTFIMGGAGATQTVGTTTTVHGNNLSTLATAIQTVLVANGDTGATATYGASGLVITSGTLGNSITPGADTLMNTSSTVGVYNPDDDTDYNTALVALTNTAGTAITGTIGGGDILEGSIVIQDGAGAAETFVMGGGGATQTIGTTTTVQGNSMASLISAINGVTTAVGGAAFMIAASSDSSSGGMYLQSETSGHALTVTSTLSDAFQENNVAANPAGHAVVIGTPTAAMLGPSTGTVNTSDVLTGSIKIGNATFTMGTSAYNSANPAATGIGSTTLAVNGDTITDLARAINADSATLGVTALASTTGIQLTTTTNTGAAIGLSGANTLKDMTQGTDSIVTLGEFASASDTLSGSLNFTVGSGSPQAIPMTQGETVNALVAQINLNSATYGVTALWVPVTGGNGYGNIQLTSNNTGTAGQISGASSTILDTATTATLNYASSSAYNTGLSDGTTNRVYDSTSGQSNSASGAATFVSNQKAGSGIATTSYSDGAGQALNGTDLLVQADAETALTDLNTAVTDIAAQDGYIGAQINTLNSISQVMSTQQENVVSAQNAVQATDYASATSNMSKYEILSQTGIAALAQANSVQQEVTKLLQ